MGWCCLDLCLRCFFALSDVMYGYVRASLTTASMQTRPTTVAMKRFQKAN